MFGTHDLLLFIASGLLLNITPGADTLYIVTHSATRGARAGVAAAFGVSLGCCFHILAAALGLSALLAASASAFTIVKLVGAAYLVYVGVSMWRSRSEAPADVAKPVPQARWRSVLAQGFLTNALNPKVALFFLAFMPQFIAPDAPHKALAFLFLGTIFNINGTLWSLFLVWSATRVSALGIGRRNALWLSRGVGALFVALGLRLAFAKPA